MAERTKEVLADLYEQDMAKRGVKRSSLECQSEDEAILLTYEMKRRGWKAEVSTAFAMTDEKRLQSVHVCRVTGRSARRG